MTTADEIADLVREIEALDPAALPSVRRILAVVAALLRRRARRLATEQGRGLP